MKTLLILGFGYSARVLAKQVLAQGWRVIGTTRDAARAAEIRALGAEAVLLPADLRPVLAQASHILASAAPDGAGDPFLLANPEILDARPEWLGYLSTTGVYGDHAGAWVDEDTPLTPSTTRGQWRVQAEAAWRATKLPLHIFRLAGIYGPGRGPFQKVKDGSARRIIKEGQVFSRIHVEDIATAVWASMTHPHPGRVYNLCDNDPAPPEDVLAYAAHLLGLPPPPAIAYDAAEMTPMARSFYAESKRVRNLRLTQELGVALRYPSYREGLEALLALEG